MSFRTTTIAGSFAGEAAPLGLTRLAERADELHLTQTTHGKPYLGEAGKLRNEESGW